MLRRGENLENKNKIYPLYFSSTENFLSVTFNFLSLIYFLAMFKKLIKAFINIGNLDFLIYSIIPI